MFEIIEILELEMQAITDAQNRIKETKTKTVIRR